MSMNEYLYTYVCLSVTGEGLTSSQNDSYQLRLGFQFILTFGWLGQCGDLHQLGLGAVMGERE